MHPARARFFYFFYFFFMQIQVCRRGIYSQEATTTLLQLAQEGQFARCEALKQGFYYICVPSVNSVVTTRCCSCRRKVSSRAARPCNKFFIIMWARGSDFFFLRPAIFFPLKPNLPEGSGTRGEKIILARVFSLERIERSAVRHWDCDTLFTSACISAIYVFLQFVFSLKSNLPDPFQSKYPFFNWKGLRGFGPATHFSPLCVHIVMKYNVMMKLEGCLICIMMKLEGKLS